MKKTFFSFLCACGLFVSCVINKQETNSDKIIHDFFYPNYYTNRPCLIVDTLYLPVDSAYLVKTFFLQKIDTAFVQDASMFWKFTRPCGDTARMLKDDRSDSKADGSNTVLVADTHFTLEGYFMVYSSTNHEFLDQLYPNGKIISLNKEKYGYTCAEEMFPHLSFLTKRCDSIAHQYPIVYDNYNIDMNSLSIPMTYVRFVVLPNKK